MRVITGKDKGKTGTVARAFPRENTVIIDGVNTQKHHRKVKKGEAQGGGIVSVSAPIHVSNVQILDPKTNAPTRIGVTKDAKTGKNVRVTKKSATTLK